MQLKGIPASAGVAWGRALHIRASTLQNDNAATTTLLVPSELERFDAAVMQAGEDLTSIRNSLLAAGRTEEADIIEVQLVLLKDRELVGKARDKIANRHYTSQAALEETMAEVLRALRLLNPTSYKERAPDFEDVVHRVIRVLRGDKGVLEGIGGSDGLSLVLLCDNLSPSEAVSLDPRMIAGVAVANGSASSHFAIIARSIGIPLVVGIGQELQHILDGQLVLLNGTSGTLTVDPSKGALEECRPSEAELAREPAVRCTPMQERREEGISLMANISSVSGAFAAQACGADGVGLFRTEFLFMGRDDFPSEDEQFETYRAVVSAFEAETPIVIRTMDVGGDKPLPQLMLQTEDNPFLGIRGMRISLMRQDLLRTQLRAVLRASAYGNIKLLFPMIATIREWKQATAVVEQVKAELAQSGIAFNPRMETGLMIEVPSAALLADRFAQEADFFSIGTNDLIQYTMAASRNSPALNELHDPLQPAVLRLIHHVVRASHDNNKQVSICGEMASDAAAVPLLLGLGLDAFSVGNEALPAVSRQMRMHSERRDKEDLRLAALAVLELDDASEVRKYVERRFSDICQ